MYLLPEHVTRTMYLLPEHVPIVVLRFTCHTPCFVDDTGHFTFTFNWFGRGQSRSINCK